MNYLIISREALDLLKEMTDLADKIVGEDASLKEPRDSPR